MLRKAASKALWLTRGAALFGGAVVTLALVLGVATVALGANGGNFILGKNNAATALTRLTGNVDGAAVQVINSNTGSDDTALNLQTQDGEEPMRVTSDTRVNNLNADKLDGKDFEAFDIDDPINAAGPLPVQSGFSTSGGQVLILASGSGYRNAGNPSLDGFIGMNLIVDGDTTVTARAYTNEVLSHKAFVDQHFFLDDLPAGPHIVRLEPVYEPACNTPSEATTTFCTVTDATDSFQVSVVEMPE